MNKRFSLTIAYLLLVLMPLQALAAANMLVCNSIMQSSVSKDSADAMPCHQQLESSKTQQYDQHQHPSKAQCVSMCASVCAITAMPSQLGAAIIEKSSQMIDFKYINYVSVIQASLQRPPIFLS